MKPMKKKWIALWIGIIVISLYNAFSSIETINGWYGDATTFYWIQWIILIYSYCSIIIFSGLLGIRLIEYSIKRFEKYILNIINNNPKDIEESE